MTNTDFDWTTLTSRGGGGEAPTEEKTPPAYGSFSSPATATSKAVADANANADQAAKNIDLAKQLGISTTAVAGDPEAAKRQVNAGNAAFRVMSSPILQQYINQNPEASKVSNDDWQMLGDMGEVINQFPKGLTPKQVWQGVEHGADALMIAGGLMPVFTGPVGLPIAGLAAIPSILMHSYDMFDRLKTIAETPEVDDGTEEGAFRARQMRKDQDDAIVSLGMMLGGLNAAAPKVSKESILYRSSPTEIDAFLRQAGFEPEGPRPGESQGQYDRRKIDEFLAAREAKGRTGKETSIAGLLPPPDKMTPLSEEALKAGKMPPTGADALIDKFKMESAAHDLELFDKVFGMAQVTKTKGRSPEALESFFRIPFGENTLSVPLEAVQKLYDNQMPAVGDKLLGFDSRIVDKYNAAMNSNEDIQLLMRQVLTHMDPSTYQALKDDFVLRNAGVSNNEGKEIGKQKEPPVSTLDKLLENLDTEYESLDQETVSDKDYLEALENAINVGVKPIAERLKSAQWAMDNKRPDIAEALAARAESRAQSLSTVPDVPEDSPRYVKAKQQLEDLKTQAVEEANKLREIAGPVKVKVRPPKAEQPELSVLSNSGKIMHSAMKLAERSIYFQPLFQDQKTLSLTKPTYARLFNLIEGAENEDFQKLFARETRLAKKRLSPEWEANRKRMEEEATIDMKYESGIAADKFIRTGVLPNGARVPGRQKLLRSIVERFVKAGQAPKEILDLYTHPEGVPPDDIASKLDFNSGAQMIKELGKYLRDKGDQTPAQYLKDRIDEETNTRMEQRYGDLSKNIFDEATEAALAQYHIDILDAEMNIIRENLGDQAPEYVSKEDLKKNALQELGNKPAGEIQSEVFRKASEKSAKLAFDAATKKDWPTALKMKQAEVIAIYKMKEALAFEKRFNKAMDGILNKYGMNRTLSNVMQDSVNQIHNMMRMVGLPQPRENSELSAALGGPTSLIDYIHNKAMSGFDPIVNTDLLSKNTRWENYDFSRFTMNEFDSFMAGIESVDNIGRREKFLDNAGNKIDFELAIEQGINELTRYKPVSETTIPARNWIRKTDAFLRKPEQLLDWASDSEPLGIFNQIFKNLSNAKIGKYDDLKKLGQQIKALRKLASVKEMHKIIGEKIDNQVLMDWKTGNPMVLTHADLLGMMVHFGNTSNFDKLTAPFEWLGQQKQLDPIAIKMLVKENATKGHWDFVQGLWDIMADLWPRGQELAWRTSGTAPMEIKPRALSTEFGEYKGGYWPLRADPRWVGPRGDASNVFGLDRYFRASPPSRWDHARTAAAYPLNLDISSAVPLLSEYIHDLNFREPLMDAARFLLDKRIQQQMNSALGEAHQRQIEPWLAYIGSGKSVNDQSLVALNEAARWSRERIVTAQLLYRFSTILKHSVAAAVDSFGEVGIPHFSNNFVKIWMSPDSQRLQQEIYEKFGEIRHRAHDQDRDIGARLDQAIGNPSMWNYAIWLGAQGTTIGDLATAYPTALTAYEQALEAGHDEDTAIYLGNKAVRNAHGSSGVTDLAPIMRSNDLTKLLTVAFSFFNHSENRIRSIGRDVKTGIEDFRNNETARAYTKFGRAAWRTLFYLAILGYAEQKVEKGMGHAQTWPEWLGEQAMDEGVGVLHQVMGAYPVVRDFSYGIGKAIQSTAAGKKIPHDLMLQSDPMIQLPEAIGKGIYSTYQTAMGHMPERAPHDVIQMLGYLANIPGSGQIAESTQFWWDLHENKQQAENPYRVGRGLLLGKSHPEELPGAKKGWGGSHRSKW